MKFRGYVNIIEHTYKPKWSVSPLIWPLIAIKRGNKHEMHENAAGYVAYCFTVHFLFPK